MEQNKELVICIYEENGISVKDKVLEVFETYLKSILQKEKSL